MWMIDRLDSAHFPLKVSHLVRTIIMVYGINWLRISIWFTEYIHCLLYWCLLWMHSNIGFFWWICKTNLPIVWDYLIGVRQRISTTLRKRRNSTTHEHLQSMTNYYMQYFVIIKKKFVQYRKTTHKWKHNAHIICVAVFPPCMVEEFEKAKNCFQNSNYDDKCHSLWQLLYWKQFFRIVTMTKFRLYCLRKI